MALVKGPGRHTARCFRATQRMQECTQDAPQQQGIAHQHANTDSRPKRAVRSSASTAQDPQDTRLGTLKSRHDQDPPARATGPRVPPLNRSVECMARKMTSPHDQPTRPSPTIPAHVSQAHTASPYDCSLSHPTPHDSSPHDQLNRPDHTFLSPDQPTSPHRQSPGDQRHDHSHKTRDQHPAAPQANSRQHLPPLLQQRTQPRWLRLGLVKITPPPTCCNARGSSGMPLSARVARQQPGLQLLWWARLQQAGLGATAARSPRRQPRRPTALKPHFLRHDRPFCSPACKHSRFAVLCCAHEEAGTGTAREPLPSTTDACRVAAQAPIHLQSTQHSTNPPTLQ
ncbi:hypothetical protein COO60DRAFT_843644 [Scenedesmus sp. NREL 46B-D3]|nr:hypothetical protein COO60DRAFT_843644 [Scenedesmus sp. NREL 46B-D3]